eukprot:1161129-Pelagomonas_calceolata.AAC.1
MSVCMSKWNQNAEEKPMRLLFGKWLLKSSARVVINAGGLDASTSTYTHKNRAKIQQMAGCPHFMLTLKSCHPRTAVSWWTIVVKRQQHSTSVLDSLECGGHSYLVSKQAPAHQSQAPHHNCCNTDLVIRQVPRQAPAKLSIAEQLT